MNRTSVSFWKAVAARLTCVGLALAGTTTARAQALSPCILSDNFISWWRADGNADDSVDGNHGVLVNGATYADGHVGQAFNLDGVDDFVNVGYLPQLQGATGFTVMAWVYKISTHNNAGIIGKWDTTPYWRNNTFLLHEQGGFSFILCFSDHSGAGTSSNAYLPVGSWVHVAATWRSSDGAIRLYRNGQLVASGTGGAGQTLKYHQAYSAKIGEWGIVRNSSYKFHGLIDEAAIFDRALDPTEIRAAAARPPTADAGADQTVDEATLVTLVGSGSTNPAGGSVTYEWTQIAGSAVTLSDPTSPSPTFTAPLVSFGGETLTFQLVVNDCELASVPDTVNITVANVNHAPVAVAGDDQTVAELAIVTLNGSGSFDQDGDPFTYSWTQLDGEAVTLDLTDPVYPVFIAPPTGPQGSLLAFELTVDDGWDSGVDVVMVQVENVNHAPEANAGPDQTLTEGAAVALDATLSSDPDDDPLAFAWVQLAGTTVTLVGADTATPTFVAPQVGCDSAELLFQVHVDDGYGGTDTDEVSIIVQEAESPPVCTDAEPSVDYLWPPDHKLVPVRIEGVRDRSGDGDGDNDDDHERDERHRRYRSKSRGHCGRGQVSITILGVTQDEPVNGLGDGDTGPDAVIQGETVLMRAERSKNGNGRVYHVQFMAEDEDGGTCFGEVSVCVPHDNRGGVCRRGHGDRHRPNPVCVDDGQSYDSLIP